MPIRRRIVPWAKPSTKKAMKHEDERRRSNAADAAQELPDVHGPSLAT